MAGYVWSPSGMTDPLVLPSGAAGGCLALAGREQLQVLLWLSAHKLCWDAAACAQALSLPVEECEGCRRFWEEQGLLLPADAASAPAVDSVPAARPPLARPAAVKPQLTEVLAYQRQHPEFGVLAQEASARLGKPIGHGDTATLLYLLDTVGLPMEVILTEIAYCVSIGKANMRYIERLALEWADRDLTTLAAVDEHIHELERCRAAARQVEGLLQLPRPLTAAQAQLAEKWLNRWHFSEAMLQRAAAITAENTGKFAPAYMDRILERWQAEGIDTPEKISADQPKKKKGAAATNPEQSSLDIESFEAETLRYRPAFSKSH